MKTVRGLIAIFGLACSTVAALAADGRPSLAVPRIDREPTLEEFLDMAPPPDLRGRLAHVTGFVQQVPEDGQPASQKTDVWLAHDDQALYVVFCAFDDEPDKIHAHVGRRETIFRDETVEIQIDSFGDGQRAFSFLTNPFGIQWDAIWTEGQGFDGSWDTVWKSRGERTDRGYVVWMAIPFRSLRFRALPPDVEHEWRVVFVRDIPRNNETSFWPQVTQKVEGRLNQAATMTGFAGVSPSRNIQLIPYATARRFRVLADDAGGGVPGFVRDGFDPDAGLDAKFVLRDRLTLDVTANPDFSQVESDQPQVTTNERFEVFFPEKRPFFLENADLFQTTLNLLFTRRIADPRGGVRLTGKTGNYTFGALAIDDEAPGKRAAPGQPGHGDAARFGVVRVMREFGNQSRIGLMATERTWDEARNRVGGVDARVRLSDTWDMRAQAVAATTRTIDGEKLSDPAYSLMFNRQSEHFGAHLHVDQIGREFRTESGFVPRVDIRDAHAELRHDFRYQDRAIVRWRPSIFVQRITDLSGARLDEQVTPGLSWEFRRRTSFAVWQSRGRTRLRPQDFPSLVADRDYDTDETGFSFETTPVGAFQASAEVELGRAVNFVPPTGSEPEPADRRYASVELTWHPFDRLRTDLTWLETRLEDPASNAEILTDRIARLKLNWQFTRRLSLRAILQHDALDTDPAFTSLERREDLNGDLLLTYLINPWTAVYVGTNRNRRNVDLTDDLSENARQVFVKLSYLFRL